MAGKQNFYDQALDGVLDMVNRVSDSMSKEFKGANPFDKKPVDPKELRYWYEHLSSQDMDYFVGKYGEDAVGDFIASMENQREGVR